MNPIIPLLCVNEMEVTNAQSIIYIAIKWMASI